MDTSLGPSGDCKALQRTERFNIGSPARGEGLDIELQEALSTNPGLGNRVMTPEPPAAEKRSIEYSRDVGRSRRRVDDTGDSAADYDGATTCSMASDEDVVQSMDSIDEIDRWILASVIMSVDVTWAFSPARVNKLAAKFRLVPGASLVLANSWDFSRAKDQIKAWNPTKKTAPYVVIGFPVYYV